MPQPISEFFDNFFVKPLEGIGQPFNPINTATYALIALLAAYLIYKALRRSGVQISEGFFYATLPFIAFGAAVRVVVDAGALPRSIDLLGLRLYPLITPGIYFTTATLFALALFAALVAAQRLRLRFEGVLLSIGALSAAFAIAPLTTLFVNWLQALTIVALALFGPLLFFLLRYARNRGLGDIESIAVFAQSTDGAATLVGISTAQYIEQHVLASALFTLPFGPGVFYALKIVLSIAFVEIVAAIRDKQLSTYLLLLLTILGGAPGLRDTLRILAGV